MTALPFSLPADYDKAVPSLAPWCAAQLNWLRMLFRSCRAKARLDLFHACAILACNRETSAQAYADALLRALSAGSARDAVFYKPGTAEISFNESWLMSLIEAARRGDIASCHFLLRSRLPHRDRRQIGWLAARLADCYPNEKIDYDTYR